MRHYVILLSSWKGFALIFPVVSNIKSQTRSGAHDSTKSLWYMKIIHCVKKCYEEPTLAYILAYYHLIIYHSPFFIPYIMINANAGDQKIYRNRHGFTYFCIGYESLFNYVVAN